MTAISITHGHRKHRAVAADGGLFAGLDGIRTLLTSVAGLAVVARISAATDSAMPGRDAHIERVALVAMRAQGFVTGFSTSNNERGSAQNLPRRAPTLRRDHTNEDRS